MDLSRTIGIRYNSLIGKDAQAPIMWNAFSTINSMGQGLMWKQSQNPESIVAASFMYSTSEMHKARTMGVMYDSYAVPKLDIGRNFVGIVSNPVCPFFDTVIEDTQKIIQSVEYRIGTNEFHQLNINDGDYLDALQGFSFVFDEFGTIPCQIRLILSTGEIFYSDIKYALIDLLIDTDVKMYLTSPSNKEDSNLSIGGRNSNITLGEVTRIISTDGVSAFDTEIQVEDASCFPESGYIVLGSEIISYNNKTLEYPFYLKGITRGVFGTLPSSHRDGTIIGVMGGEYLFNHVPLSELESEYSPKIDYRCVCVRNDSAVNSGDISLFFPVSPHNNIENVRFAIERSLDGNTIFSQELVNEYAEPSVGAINEYLPSDFLTDGRMDDIFDTTLDDSGGSSDSFDFSDDFGIIKSTNVFTDDNYIFLAVDAVEGEIRYRFDNKSLSTIENFQYNSSVKFGTSITVSYRAGKTLDEIKGKDFIVAINHNEVIETRNKVKVEDFVRFLDIKISMNRNDTSTSSPSFGDLLIQSWNSGYSKYVRNSDEFKERNLVIDTKFFANTHEEFKLSFPEDTESNYLPLQNYDNYIIQSTFAKDVGLVSLPIKFNHALAHSFVPYQNSSIRELVIHEKRIDWDNSENSEIDLTLNAFIYDGDPQSGGKIIGSSSQLLTLTDKVAHSSNRVFEFDNEIPLKACREYWFYIYASSDPSVNGEWRFRGSNNLIYGNPDSNKTKLFNLNRGATFKNDIDDFAIGYTVLGSIRDKIVGHINNNSTVYYRLSPNGLNDKDWNFNELIVNFNNPYSGSPRLGPKIHFAWRKNTEDCWHRFRPGRLTKSKGAQTLTVSERYRKLKSDEYIIIRITFDKCLNATSVNDIRSAGLFGFGAQSAISKLQVCWEQFCEFSPIKNLVSNWMQPPTNFFDSIKMSDIYSGWNDDLKPNEQFFVWISRDYSGMEEPISQSGIAMVVNHGLNKLFQLNQYDITQWEQIPGEETLPSPPASVTAPEFSGTGTYSITWDESDGAVLYQIEEASSPYEFLATVSTNFFTVKNRTDGIYTYRVKAINSVGESSYTISNPTLVEVGNFEQSSSSSLSSSSSSSSSTSSHSSSSLSSSSSTVNKSTSSNSSSSSSSSSTINMSTSSTSESSSSTINKSTSSNSSSSSSSSTSSHSSSSSSSSSSTVNKSTSSNSSSSSSSTINMSTSSNSSSSSSSTQDKSTSSNSSSSSST